MKSFNMRMTTSALALISLVATGTASAAGVFQEFTINETIVPGVTDSAYSAVVADKLNGGYVEQLTIGNIPDASGNLAFETWGYATFSALYANDGADVVDAYLGSAGGSGYLIRALFYSTGLYNTTTNLFTGATATFSMYIDADKNTGINWGADASVDPTLANTSDDFLLGTATNPTKLAGIPGTPGAFDFIWDNFLLTDEAGDQDGNGYFIAPRPFHLVFNSNGDFDRASFGPGTTTVTGDISGVFMVPEPGTTALLGLGVLALGRFASRRKV